MKKLTYICPCCRIQFQRYQSQVTTESPFCSRSCRAKSRVGPLNPFFGREHTPEAKEKLRARDRSRWKTPEFREKMRVVGANNLKGCSGTGFQDRWVELYGLEGAEERRAAWKAKLSIAFSGSRNHMFGKPAPLGSGNGWKGWYKGWFFRSLRELTYMVSHIEANDLIWENAEKADLGIPYQDYKGTDRTYYADFLIDGKRLVEVKPERLIDSPSVACKADAARSFCESRGLSYEIVDPGTLPFDEIRHLVDEGHIVFHNRYQAKFDLMKDKIAGEDNQEQAAAA